MISNRIEPMVTRRSAIVQRTERACAMHGGEPVHADRALGGDLDHLDHQRRCVADRGAGHQPSPGQRGGTDPPGGPGRRRTPPSTTTPRAGFACSPIPRSVESTRSTGLLDSDATPRLQPDHPDPAGTRLQRRARHDLPADQQTSPVSFSTITPLSYYPPCNTPGSNGFYPYGNLNVGGVTNSVLMIEQQRFQPHAQRTAERADLMVLEHPGRRPDPDQQLRPLVHGRRSHVRRPDQSVISWAEPRALRERGAAGDHVAAGKRRNQRQSRFLFLVNGQDDNGNGWVDEGLDGVDNNGITVIDELAEWETGNVDGPRRRTNR